ncbi:GDP/GTP exchange factor Sec2p [Poseidonocella pacifica]|uniref:GDP/GTP exchange factor Sec2p n=1 Tax=Poseidonocella pacifica TaxID=871651 RepID=A0A1I0WU98_9RHOB|nr:DNA-binding protein [Poseidonocella pacifica]SFA91748.1 GDP/GTP exchange factor Sec2p [Poseidonocella pacifica]
MATKTHQKNAALEKKAKAAVIELEKLGKPITNANVREQIGGCSFRDLSPIVKAIVAEKEARAQAESKVPDMPDEVAELSTALWETAFRAADEAAALSRRAHANEVAELRKHLDEWETNVGTVEDELETMKARAQGAEAAKAELEEQVADLRMVIAGLEGRLLGRQEAARAAAKEDKNAATDLEDACQMPLFGDPAGEEGLPLTGDGGDAVHEDLEQGDKDDGDLDNEAA